MKTLAREGASYGTSWGRPLPAQQRKGPKAGTWVTWLENIRRPGWPCAWNREEKAQERTRGRNKGRSREEGNNFDFRVHPVRNSNL